MLLSLLRTFNRIERLSQHKRKTFLNIIKTCKVIILKYLQSTANLFFTLIHSELLKNSTLLESYNFLNVTVLYSIHECYMIQNLVCLKLASEMPITAIDNSTLKH